jgi:hypothetical protein
LTVYGRIRAVFFDQGGLNGFYLILLFEYLFFFILGTVVDTDIVSSSGFYFYFNSDAAIRGQPRSMLYQVLHDQIGFTPDEIQQLK